MRRTVLLLAVAAVAVVAAPLVASGLAGGGDTQRAARVAAAAVAAAAGTYLVRRIPGAGGGIGQPQDPDAFERVRWRGPAPARAPDPPERARLQRLVRLSVSSADHAHRRLRPILRDVADARFEAAFGTHPDRDPRAAGLLGPHAWEWVRPDRPEPADRHGRGPGLEEIEAAVAGIAEAGGTDGETWA